MGLDTRQNSQIASLAILGFAAISAVALRFWARYRSKASFWADDWLVLAALVFFLCYDFVALYGKITLPNEGDSTYLWLTRGLIGSTIADVSNAPAATPYPILVKNLKVHRLPRSHLSY